MKKNIKKILKVLGIFLLIILVALIAYLIYLFASYHRIPDNQALKIEKTSDGTAAADTLTTEKEYSALTYNVGFGAYTPDFSFFMDGGKSSWAKSKESVESDIQGAGELVASKDPDFALIQEVDLNSTRSYHVDEYSILRIRFQVTIRYLHRITIPHSFFIHSHSRMAQPFRTCSFLQISGYGFSEKKLSDIDKLQQVL